jgi:hypothetical protein
MRRGARRLPHQKHGSETGAAYQEVLDFQRNDHPAAQSMKIFPRIARRRDLVSTRRTSGVALTAKAWNKSFTFAGQKQFISGDLVRGDVVGLRLGPLEEKRGASPNRSASRQHPEGPALARAAAMCGEA